MAFCRSIDREINVSNTRALGRSSIAGRRTFATITIVIYRPTKQVENRERLSSDSYDRARPCRSSADHSWWCGTKKPLYSRADAVLVRFRGEPRPTHHGQNALLLNRNHAHATYLAVELYWNQRPRGLLVVSAENTRNSGAAYTDENSKEKALEGDNDFFSSSIH